ncbi:hypothetical protein B0T17DRAFT_481392 [Bombardia bombarda]|uniref:Uncharacterized protein n=1 Tax=Bombardia bombarda TaxID=252184 RepID=A0AA39XLZ8_9PEZI|nr:hypothetical protein B0T17DRAFT_481392 [Bombardia bombarda]
MRPTAIAIAAAVALAHPHHAAAIPLSSSTAAASPPSDFTANPKVGPGGTKYKDSPHFRIYGASTDALASGAISMLEAAYTCFVDDLGWRSPGLSYRQDTDDGPWNKLNVYQVDTLPGAAANTPLDTTLGLAWLNVVKDYMAEPAVVVHEFGHALTYAERYWIDQGRTGAWWETLANFVADTYITSPLCARARAKYNQDGNGNTLIDLKKVIGDSHQVIVDGTANTANHYQAWPFFSYMLANPDSTPGLGAGIFPAIWTRYKRNSNETPLHVLERLVSPTTRIQTVVARYWARMAFVDIGHPKAQAQFASQRTSLTYANLDSQGNGRYRVKGARRPRYMGANIIPLKTTAAAGNVTAAVTAAVPFTAMVAVKGANGGAVRYVELVKGTGQVAVGSGEEAMLVVVNTPGQLILFDPFQLTSEANNGVDYTVQLTGATA